MRRGSIQDDQGEADGPGLRGLRPDSRGRNLHHGGRRQGSQGRAAMDNGPIRARQQDRSHGGIQDGHGIRRHGGTGNTRMVLREVRSLRVQLRRRRRGRSWHRHGPDQQARGDERAQRHSGRPAGPGDGGPQWEVGRKHNRIRGSREGIRRRRRREVLRRHDRRGLLRQDRGVHQGRAQGPEHDRGLSSHHDCPDYRTGTRRGTGDGAVLRLQGGHREDDAQVPGDLDRNLPGSRRHSARHKGLRDRGSALRCPSWQLH